MTYKFCHEGQQLCRQVHRRATSVEHVAQKCWDLNFTTHRSYASAAAATDTKNHDQHQNVRHIAKSPLGRQAQQKEADREFFADLISSAATKRDAKAYLTRLKSPPKAKPAPTKPNLQVSGSYVNVGNLFRGSRAAEMSPVFSQSAPVEAEFQEQETLHVALVKIRDVAQLAQKTLSGIAETLAQLNRLSVSPCVVLESTTTDRGQLGEEIDKLVNAINDFGNAARRVDNALTIGGTEVRVSQRKLLMRPLQRDKIPVIANVAYNEDEQRMTLVPVNDAVLALTKEFAGLNIKSSKTEDWDSSTIKEMQKQVSLDRIITIDAAGGIPNEKAADGRHVFLNLEQEYDIVRARLQAKVDSPAAITHLSNLDLLDQALQLLPPTASGLLTTHDEAANHGRLDAASHNPSNVGTRRQKNALIHNILTDKPAYSSSLPIGRLTKNEPLGEQLPLPSHSSFVKRGMPITIFPNPFETPWVPRSRRLKLTDPRIDLARLVYLIEDSFGRKLDLADYLGRVNDRIAGVIIAGNYEGGAILTWETAPDAPEAELVPYLDKFAVLKRSQGAGGVADIVFNAMVRSCFPNGVCWRSRKDNPVNKWYFERSRGTWKIPDMNWTMFFTTPGVEVSDRRFKEYESVCRGVKPSWADKKKPAD